MQFGQAKKKKNNETIFFVVVVNVTMVKTCCLTKRASDVCTYINIYFFFCLSCCESKEWNTILQWRSASCDLKFLISFIRWCSHVSRHYVIFFFLSLALFQSCDCFFLLPHFHPIRLAIFFFVVGCYFKWTPMNNNHNGNNGCYSRRWNSRHFWRRIYDSYKYIVMRWISMRRASREKKKFQIEWLGVTILILLLLCIFLPFFCAPAVMIVVATTAVLAVARSPSLNETVYLFWLPTVQLSRIFFLSFLLFVVFIHLH